MIADFLAADVYLVTTPMWNLSVPYALKYYIDSLVQPGYVFRFDEQGYPVPMVHGKRMVCVTTRGADYGPDTRMHAFDFQEPYLRAIFGFIGITDIDFVNVQPMDATRETARRRGVGSPGTTGHVGGRVRRAPRPCSSQPDRQ